MAISDDILIDYTNKRIYQDHAYDEAVDTERDTQELYTYLMDEFDEQAQMDDPIPMTAQTPNAFTMVNGWFIDDETIKWFKDGAVETLGWNADTYADGIRLLLLDGTSGLTSDDIGTAVSGSTTGDTGTLMAYNTNRNALWVRTDGLGDLFDDNSETIYVDGVSCGDMNGAGSITGENLYVNLYTLGTLAAGTDTIYIIQDNAKIDRWWSTGIDGCDVLIKVKEMGTTIDGGDVTVFCRNLPDTEGRLYDHFDITLTAGRQAVPLSTSLDLNNETALATISGYAVLMSWSFAGPYSRDLNNGAGAKDYACEIDCGGQTLAKAYEACKFVTFEDYLQTIDTEEGFQYISASGAWTPVKASPFGTFAGGTFFGARGIWLANYDSTDSQNFQLIASDGTTQTPPNTVACRVSSVQVGDSVAMFMLDGDGGNIEKDTYSLNGDQGAGSTTLVVNEAITNNWASQDPPQSGYLRVVRGTDLEVLKEYTSWTGSTFTLSGTLGVACSGNDPVYVPVIDAAVASGTFIDNTLIQSQTIYVRTRVRHYGGAGSSILPFEIDGNITSAGITVPAIRTDDSIVT
jgi:hypothetical protein